MTVSVITVTYNAADTVSEAVRSVVEQRGNFKLDYHIVDGASTDTTLAAIEPFKDRIAKITSDPDHGLYDAMNRGLARAKGDIIGILNADDRFADERVVSDIIAAFEATEADGIYADLDYVKAEDGETVTRQWKSGHPGNFNRGWMPPHPTLFVRRSLYEQHGLFNLQLSSAADYELMLRFFHFRGAELAYLPRVTVKMRTGGKSNASLYNRLKANAEDAAAWRLNGIRPPTLLRIQKPFRKLSQFGSR
ncbi:MAG: glycosyl transferase [Crocinitomicaceae bacterium]|nr:glycosyl transferase [Crocinitomicaceae bacterium]